MELSLKRQLWVEPVTFAAGGPRAAFIDNYFRIQQPITTVNCSGIITISNPSCLTPTWSITSGPAIISGGQGTNAVQIQATGAGTVHIVASAGNYTDEIDFNIASSSPAPITNIDEQKINNGCVTETSIYTVIGGTGATNYKWYYRKLPSGTFALRKDSPENFYTMTQSIPLRACSDYEIKVEASNSCSATPVVKTIQSTVCPCNNIYTVAPNPATSSITISLSATDVKAAGSNNTMIDKVSIYDQQGNLKKQRKSGMARQIQIDINDLVNGIYIIEVSGSNYSEKHKLMVQK